MEKKLTYAAPELEAHDIAVEQGFAQSVIGEPVFEGFGTEEDWE